MGVIDTFVWNGDAVGEKMRAAIRFGMDSVMADCVVTAKGLVHVRTSVLQGSIQMRPAVDEGSRIIGIWGSYSVNYAIFIEEGTQPHVIYPRFKKALYWPGADHPVRMVNHPGNPAYPFLRPAADMHYPSLGLRIKAQFAWGAA